MISLPDFAQSHCFKPSGKSLYVDAERETSQMNHKKPIKIMLLYASLIVSSSTVASDNRNHFQGIDTVDQLLALSTSKLCAGGGPSSDDIRLILLNGQLALPMYQNDPEMARILIDKQSVSVKNRIREKCSSKTITSSRKLTKEMLRNESETCQLGAPTKDEIKEYIKESIDSNIDIDKQLRAIPHEYRLIMEEGAKLKGLTFREMFIEDVATKASLGWEKACANKSYSKNNRNELTTPVNIEEEYRTTDKRLNDTWKALPSQKRKLLLLSQREWIKKQANCNQDIQCLIDMTKKRIIELEVENKDAK